MVSLNFREQGSWMIFADLAAHDYSHLLRMKVVVLAGGDRANEFSC